MTNFIMSRKAEKERNAEFKVYGAACLPLGGGLTTRKKAQLSSLSLRCLGSSGILSSLGCLGSSDAACIRIVKSSQS